MLKKYTIPYAAFQFRIFYQNFFFWKLRKVCVDWTKKRNPQNINEIPVKTVISSVAVWTYRLALADCGHILHQKIVQTLGSHHSNVKVPVSAYKYTVKFHYFKLDWTMEKKCSNS